MAKATDDQKDRFRALVPEGPGVLVVARCVAALGWTAAGGLTADGSTTVGTALDAVAATGPCTVRPTAVAVATRVPDAVSAAVTT